MKGIYVCSIEEARLFSRGDTFEIAKIKKSLESLGKVKQNQRGFMFFQMERPHSTDLKNHFSF